MERLDCQLLGSNSEECKLLIYPQTYPSDKEPIQQQVVNQHYWHSLRFQHARKRLCEREISEPIEVSDASFESETRSTKAIKLGTFCLVITTYKSAQKNSQNWPLSMFLSLNWRIRRARTYCYWPFVEVGHCHFWCYSHVNNSKASCWNRTASL